MRYVVFFGLIVTFNIVSFAQSVTAFHDVQSTGENNSYTIKTKVSGLQGVDIARITYFIDNKHTYKASPNNAFFSDRNEKYVKFYIMAVPASGEINVELGLTLSGAGEFAFPVEFQYSKDEEKKSVNLPQISIAGEAIALVEETPAPEETPVEEEVPTAEEASAKKAQEEAEAAAKKEAEEKAMAEKVAAEAKAREEAELKAEEERIAKEKADAEAKAEEQRLAQESAKKAEEELKKEKEASEKLAAEQKAQAEAEAAKKAEQERIAREKQEAEELAKAEEAKRMAEEEAAKKLEEEKSKEEIASPVTSSSKYSIQILSLSKFSQTRLNNYIREHNLDANQIVKRQVGEWTKISYGKLSSKDEAREMILKLRRSHNITDAFLVTLP